LRGECALALLLTIMASGDLHSLRRWMIELVTTTMIGMTWCEHLKAVAVCGKLCGWVPCASVAW
jgi:hypothetical protein